MGERAPWNDFPKVIRNSGLGVLKNEPNYLAAKAGDMKAALNLAGRLITDDTVKQIKELIGNEKPRLAPILGVEAAGNNKIPLAMAEVLADRLGLDVELGIIQREKVNRTGAGADHRLAFNPTFEGTVSPGQKYLIVDDTLTMGGTIASLRGYIENRGGKVVGASVMTAHEGALDLAVKPSMLAGIEQKHGVEMNTFWKENFGYGIEKLTQGEAGHLRSAASVDAIRTRISAARHAGLKRMDASRTQTAERRTAGAGQTVGVNPTGEPDFSNASVEAAEGIEREQQAMLEAAPVEQTYEHALALHVQAKHAQVERIEDKLENLIDRQQARLQQTQAGQPGRISLPSTKRAWQSKQAQQRARLQTLNNRLSVVREIKEGMGIHAPRIEEMATRKMRAENPELASDWDAMREANRRHQALMRRQEQEKKQTQAQERSRGQRLSNKLD